MKEKLSRIMRRLLSAAVLALSVWQAGYAQSEDPSQDSPAKADFMPLVTDGTLWKKTIEDLKKGMLRGLYPSPVDETVVRLSRNERVGFGDVEIGEVLLEWDAESRCITSFSTTIYNKGDDGLIDRKDYTSLLDASVQKLNALFGVKPRKGRLKKNEAAVKGNTWEWESEMYAARLEAASSGSGKKEFVAEFIRLSIAKDKDSLKRGSSKDVAHKSELKAHVKHDEDGTVWIEGIPMVDQGQKGYCVPATVSRVFAYYGMDGVDQHALAALCKSSGESGTSIGAMMQALKDISGKFHVNLKELEWRSKRIDKDFAKAEDKRGGEKEIPPAVLGKLRLEVISKCESDVKRGFRKIKEQLDKGMPVLWSVKLGLLPEQGSMQPDGGHMRLIIGYNDKTNSIVYSDSWGAGHAKKTMSMNQACVITKTVCILRPKG